MNRSYKHAKFLCIALLLLTSLATAQQTVNDVISSVVTRLYQSCSEEELAKLDEAAILEMLSPEERQILSTRYWTFDVDKPARISILRDTAQAVVPFWLTESGFEKTDKTVTNMEGWVYEVWQKTFPAGHVGLGINGFDIHRPHYLVAVGGVAADNPPEIRNLYPAGFSIVELAPGAMCYHDWSDLTLKDVPDALRGNRLLTTIRGRAREAHLLNAFRKTPFPSSNQPDSIILSWSGEPTTSQSVSWRTSKDVSDGYVRFRPKTSPSTDQKKDWEIVSAQRTLVEDRQLMNDRFVHWFSATLENLTPGTAYEYQVGSKKSDVWSEPAEFITAPPDATPFSFAYFSDTHKRPEWGELLKTAHQRHPDIAFYTISGDLVSTGLYRDDWDHFFAYSSPVFRYRPIMPALGNHDNQDGLGCWMYLTFFALPANGPKALEPERAYSFQYSNALFVVLDVTAEISDQTDWLRNQLAQTTATWKFVIFHFPPYCLEPDYDEDYADIREAWGPLFDQYNVNMVLTGHVHDYIRSHPIRNGEIVASPSEGTTYITSVAIPQSKRTFTMPAHAAAAFVGDASYQVIRIETDRVEYKAYDIQGNVRDQFVITR